MMLADEFTDRDQATRALQYGRHLRTDAALRPAGKMRNVAKVPAGLITMLVLH